MYSDNERNLPIRTADANLRISTDSFIYFLSRTDLSLPKTALAEDLDLVDFKSSFDELYATSKEGFVLSKYHRARLTLRKD